VGGGGGRAGERKEEVSKCSDLMRRRIHACNMRRRMHTSPGRRRFSWLRSYEEEATCMWYEEEDTCMTIISYSGHK
jgi:hypothetical protein